MSDKRALIVDDEPDIRELLGITLGRMGVQASPAANIAEALALLKQEHFDLCLTDMRLPDGNGLDLVADIARRHPGMPVAVITAHGNMESAITALKSGAFDFVTKPVDLKDLRNLITQALKLRGSPAAESRALIGASAAIERLRATVAKLARSQAPVYISGESGTGKELVARLIHEQGARALAAFVPVNCGAIPDELMESELFGHKKGSFTGAVADKPGLFQAADGGTLFLDEVAELPLHMQVKLLRAIQEKRVRPIGADAEVAVDCRILSATHKKLAELVEAGEFRQDLYYRINVIELNVPPLRERADDIPLLVEHFLAKKSAEFGIAAPRLSMEALEALRGYGFPGNVRELENILERALTMCEDDEIREPDLLLPEGQRAAPGGAGSAELQDYLDDVERSRILAALEQTRWNKTRAAKLLGISFRALRYRLQKLGIEG
ncbi:MAG: sigma-54-dependent Fis family transcriptional regulator [Gammaproteobacteria bacterium]|nr:sigma-54-dependent Fis family transcriptional regulator [Gammaproteobacteria bacterium]